MNEESQAQHCGDTCSAVAAMGVAFREYVPPEQRMDAAIKQVLSGKMSQRGAAAENGVARQTLQRRLEEVAQTGHPAKPQSSTGVSLRPTPASPASHLKGDGGSLERQRRLKGLREIARQRGMTSLPSGVAVSRAGLGQVYQALVELEITVPDDLLPSRAKPKAKPKTTSTPPALPVPTNDPATTERLPANDPLAVIPNWGEQGDSFDRYDSEIDSGDAVRDEVCQQVQQSNRPADFKRAIFLLRELDDICTEAWYRRHPEPWGHDDWAHVCSEVATVYSLVRQRAQEECEDALLARTAIETRATVVP